MLSTVLSYPTYAPQEAWSIKSGVWVPRHVTQPDDAWLQNGCGVWVPKAMEVKSPAVPEDERLYQMSFPQPSPFKTWGHYMDYKRRNFNITEGFYFGDLEIRRTGHRTFEVDTGQVEFWITGNSDEKAFSKLLQFMNGTSVSSNVALH